MGQGRRVIPIVAVAICVAVTCLAAATARAAAVTVVQDVRLPLAAGETSAQAMARARDMAEDRVLVKAAVVVARQGRQQPALDEAGLAALLGRVFQPEIVAEEAYAAASGPGVFVKAQLTVDMAVFEPYARAVAYNRSMGKPDPAPPQAHGGPVDVLAEALPGPGADMDLPDLSVSRGRLVDPALHNATTAAMQTASTAQGNATAAATPSAGTTEAAHLLARGRALARQGDWQDAARAYGAAIAAAPDDAAAWAARGYAYDVLGKPARMCADLARACALGLCAPQQAAQGLGLCTDADGTTGDAPTAVPAGSFTVPAKP